ncbi:hypothetical protein MRB53_007586 [Persea americana]|uniref:Uncharacterized protein n=1 Tax=Persea americana TaxID=3435 RepID=A0ACC2MKD8_PERAE|nr:hypothetical protein MRB53_007586 [Persea americana]
MEVRLIINEIRYLSRHGGLLSYVESSQWVGKPSSKKKRRSKSIEDASLEERLAYLELDMPDVEKKLEELDGSQLGFSEMVEVLKIDVKDALDGIKA